VDVQGLLRHAPRPQNITGGVRANFVSSGYSTPVPPTAEGTGATPRPRGRPRQWASEADRKRGYRQRLAVDLAEPVRLRRGLRVEKARAVRLAERVSRLEAQLDDAHQRLRTATEELERLKSINDFLRGRIATLAKTSAGDVT
jgi:hypothetical protein